MSIPVGAGLDELISTFGDAEFVPHGAIDVTLQENSSNDTLSALHVSAVELMARLDTYSQTLATNLESSLEELRRSEKRIKYQMDLLKNDTEVLASEQAADGQRIRQAIGPALASEPVQRLVEINVAKTRMNEVLQLLEQAQSFSELEETQKLEEFLAADNLDDAEAHVSRVEELVKVWEGTADSDSRLKFAHTLRRRLEASQ